MPDLILSKLDSRGVLFVTLARPNKRNAFHEEMARELTALYSGASCNSDVRLVVLRGQGPVFCAGGDIEWMRDCGTSTAEIRIEWANLISDLFYSIRNCAKPTIAAVHGAALGGAVGLLAATDFVFATSDSIFATSEAKLGIVPACLSPLLVEKIGASNARRWFLSATRKTAELAQRAGLIDEVHSDEQSLEEKLTSLVSELLLVSPSAQITAKKLLTDLSDVSADEVRSYTSQVLSDSWASPDGQEGMSAFLDRRPARWRVE